MTINGIDINVGLDNVATQHRVMLGATEFAQAGEITEGVGALRAGGPGAREITIEVFVCRPEGAAKNRESLQLDCSRLVGKLAEPCRIQVSACRRSRWEYEDFALIRSIFGVLESYEIEEFWQGRKNKLTIHIRGFVESSYSPDSLWEYEEDFELGSDFTIETESPVRLPITVEIKDVETDPATLYSDKYGRNAIVITGLAHDPATGAPAEIALDGDVIRDYVIDGGLTSGTVAEFGSGWGPVCHALPSLMPGKNKIRTTGIRSGTLTVRYDAVLL